MKWLTVNCSYSHHSLAFPMIHRACGGKWNHVEVTIKDNPAEVARRLAGDSVVCAILYLFNRPIVLDILSRVKVLQPDCVIIVGGPEAKGEGARGILEESSFVDYVCRGEGEVVMPMLLEVLRQGEKNDLLRQIPGLVYRYDGIIENPGEPVYCDWEHAPLACEDEFYMASGPFVQVETSRGCPNQCVFCTSGNSRVRYRDLSSVETELHVLHDKGVQEVRLLDRTFNLPASRAVSLLRMFRTQFPDMHFHLEVHPALLPDSLREELRCARQGQLHIEAGIQTLEPDVLEAIGRPNTLEKALDGLKFLCSLPQLAVHTDLLAGCPCQTLDSIKTNLRQLIELSPEEIQLEVLKVLPGTPLVGIAKKLGIRYAPKVPYDVMQTPDMSFADIAVAMKLSRMIDIFYNAPSLRMAFRELVLEKPDFLDTFFETLENNDMLSGSAPFLRRRFLMLEPFCRNGSQARFFLAKGWLEEAYTPGMGPAAEARFVPVLPDKLVTVKGSCPIEHLREEKYVFLPPNIYFVYNKTIAPNKAIAVLKDLFQNP